MLSRNGIITLIFIIFGLLLLYMIMRGRSAAMKKRMDDRKHFRRRNG